MSEPRDTGWIDTSKRASRRHERNIGGFLLDVWDTADGWQWDVGWGDNDIAEGEEKLTRADNDSPDAWESSLPRAKRACEDAARKAGIAVPK